MKKIEVPLEVEEILLGSSALLLASSLWGVADARYKWLQRRELPCIVLDRDPRSTSVRVAIVPGFDLFERAIVDAT